MRLLLTLLIFFSYMTAVAQPSSFSVSVTNLPTNKAKLLIYDSESTPREIGPNSSKQPLRFEGTVSKPTYAELVTETAVMPFFLENSEINVRFNSQEPEKSPIVGSRTNSLMRYQVEQCMNGIECITLFVTENPTSLIAPYLIYRYIAPDADIETLAKLYIMLDGEATSTWHYRKLHQRLQLATIYDIGRPFPNFDIRGPDKSVVPIYSLLSDTTDNIILFGASWCTQCNDALKLLESFNTGLNIIYIDINVFGWDAPFMHMLAVDHIPYIILVDRERRILARDARAWEIPRLLQATKK